MHNSLWLDFIFEYALRSCDVWIWKPCVNTRVVEAVRDHMKSKFHKDCVSDARAAPSDITDPGKKDPLTYSLILKKMRTIYFTCKSNAALDTITSLMHLQELNSTFDKEKGHNMLISAIVKQFFLCLFRSQIEDSHPREQHCRARPTLGSGHCLSFKKASTSERQESCHYD